jgi:NAD(P)H-dependent FMN reductase
MQPQLRQILASLNVMVVPQPQVTVRFADKAFNPDGSLVDSKTFQQLQKLITRAVSLAGKNKI